MPNARTTCKPYKANLTKQTLQSKPYKAPAHLPKKKKKSDFEIHKHHIPTFYDVFLGRVGSLSEKTFCVIHSLAFSLIDTLPLSRECSLSLSLSFIRTHSLSLVRALSLRRSLFVILSLANTRTLFLSLAQAHANIHPDLRSKVLVSAGKMPKDEASLLLHQVANHMWLHKPERV